MCLSRCFAICLKGYLCTSLCQALSGRAVGLRHRLQCMCPSWLVHWWDYGMCYVYQFCYMFGILLLCLVHTCWWQSVFVPDDLGLCLISNLVRETPFQYTSSSWLPHERFDLSHYTASLVKSWYRQQQLLQKAAQSAVVSEWGYAMCTAPAVAWPCSWCCGCKISNIRSSPHL